MEPKNQTQDPKGQTNKKWIPRCIALVVIVVLLLLLANSLVGNPVSSFLARKAAQQYIDTNYSALNLQIKSCIYSFKVSRYAVVVQSPTSVDTVFSVYADRMGQITSDNYEYEVANNFTTSRRLTMEMREVARETIGSKLDYDWLYLSFYFTKEEDVLAALERDMKLDIHEPPLPLSVDVILYSDAVTYETIAQVAKDLERVLQEQAIQVDGYDVRVIPLSDKPQKEGQAVTWVNSLSVMCFPAERMDEEPLAQVMEQYEAERVAEVNAETKR